MVIGNWKGIDWVCDERKKKCYASSEKKMSMLHTVSSYQWKNHRLSTSLYDLTKIRKWIWWGAFKLTLKKIYERLMISRKKYFWKLPNPCKFSSSVDSTMEKENLPKHKHHRDFHYEAKNVYKIRRRTRKYSMTVESNAEMRTKILFSKFKELFEVIFAAFVIHDVIEYSTGRWRTLME